MLKGKSLFLDEVTVALSALPEDLAVHVYAEDSQVLVPIQKAHTVVAATEGAVQHLEGARSLL
jgi:hypothetical protein